MTEQNEHLEALQDIRRIMQRSSRFISLSGLSGIAAGCWALAGAYFTYDWIWEYYQRYQAAGFSSEEFNRLKFSLFFLALAVMGGALLTAFYFTWRRASRHKVALWDHTSRQLAINLIIPLVAGGVLILAMLQHDEWRFVAPACLIFYGLALVNGSKYTLSEIRYLGLTEIALGLVCTQFIGYGLYFWTIGFGLLHIVYGFAMWWKYERKEANA